LDGTKYGLAAKRIKNLSNLRRRVKKATDQISRSSLPGLIILDLSLALNPENRRMAQVSDSVFCSEYEKRFQAAWNPHHPFIQRTIAHTSVLGIIVHDYHVRRYGADWELAGTTMRIPADAQRRDFDRISTLYVYGLPNQSDASTRPLVLP
jgi:hypothetical protein